MSITKRPIGGTPAQLRAYLKQHQAEQFVGTDPQGCVLAKWHSQRLGKPVTVGGLTAQVYSNSGRIARFMLPDWQFSVRSTFDKTLRWGKADGTRVQDIVEQALGKVA